jgi:hypothetical protein
MTLPNHLESLCSVKALRVGQYGYLNDWSMTVDTDRKCWLRADAMVSPEAKAWFGQRMDMAVMRRDDGLHVWQHYDQKHSVSEPRVHRDLVPVAELHLWDTPKPAWDDLGDDDDNFGNGIDGGSVLGPAVLAVIVPVLIIVIMFAGMMCAR